MIPTPIMIMAVLRLLEPTSPTIGRMLTSTSPINLKLVVLFFVRSVTQARRRTTATLANSEG